MSCNARGPAAAGDGARTVVVTDEPLVGSDFAPLPLTPKAVENDLPAKEGATTPATCLPTLKLQTADIPGESTETRGEFREQLWRDGNLHWGEREGDAWTERWQTQEGQPKRFGTKRGRDTKHNREWQERWEQQGEKTRIEKRVTQRAGSEEDSQEVERWIERLDISPGAIIETRVGEDRLTGRQWRVFAEYKLDADQRRVLQKREQDEVWGSGTESSRRVERTQLQPGGRVLRTTVHATDVDGCRTEETSYEDLVTGSKWGQKSRRAGEVVRTEEWSTDGASGSSERKEVCTKPGSTTGVVTSFDSATGEHYREDWGKESVSAQTQREWSSKWRQRDGGPWGDYFEKLETQEAEGAPGREEVRNEKWWTEGGERFSERWTQVKELSGGEPTTLRKFGHNEYGVAREDWEETYERDADNSMAELVLREKRLEKDNASVRTVDSVIGAIEHHTVVDKQIGQTDVWHVDTRSGDKWGEKDGSNDAGVSWQERWSEKADERWVEKKWKQGESEWGELSGWKGAKETWFEKWGKDGRSTWRERNETDVEGNESTRRCGEVWRHDGVLESQYTDNYGRTTVGEQWAYKEGFHEEHGDWVEKWNESPARKAAEKRGSCPKSGDHWFEAWTEDYDTTTGTRVRQSARKEGSNAQGDSWMETWTEEGAEKYARKSAAKTASQEEWLEEWHEEADGAKWCRKWATKGSEKWGSGWGHSDGRDWGEEWRNGERINQWGTAEPSAVAPPP